MRIAIVTDAWRPQVNGVVRTLSAIVTELSALGHECFLIEPNQFRTIPCPIYPEIQFALRPYSRVEMLMENIQPDAIHIATEGPLGWAARNYCKHKGLAFTTSFHTRFPEYVCEYLGVPKSLTYQILRRFHSRAHRTMCTTPTMLSTLKEQGFGSLCIWSRGVDTEYFRPQKRESNGEGKPHLLYVGRVSKEKNIEAFLSSKVEAKKTVVGDGPMRPQLEFKYPEVHFAGSQTGEKLIDYYNSADCFVFPSLTDTFGLVMLEALSCGVPVAAFPAPGPIDIIKDHRVGCLDWDLDTAIQKALLRRSIDCRLYAMNFSWRRSAEQFYDNLCSLSGQAPLSQASVAPLRKTKNLLNDGILYGF